MKYYSHISEIPLHNWEQLTMSGDFKWLLVKPEKDKIDYEKAVNVYFELSDQAAPLTGATEMMEKLRGLLLLKFDFVLKYLEGDKSAINWINLYDDKIKRMMKQGQNTDVVKTRLMVQKIWGQAINAKETTYLEFLKIRQIVEEQLAQNNTSNGEAG